ncbi:AMP-binding enzyme, C-terminal domain [Dillenia turbinata]|uniref:4-coumarate--CoA ligase n=1 Tax=Dillenia turbinata TaxID=194707 RepID=A0AAN8VNC2_9MAGN
MASTSAETTQIPIKSKKTQDPEKYPDWYSPETGIYHSKYPPISLPTDPFLDVVSFIFSHQHNGVSALVDSSSGSSISYSELFPLVKSIASGLHHSGVSQHDVVLVLLPNSIFFPVVFLSTLYLGAIVTPMSPLSSTCEIKKRIADCNVKFVFTVSDKIDQIRSCGVNPILVPETRNFDPTKIEYSEFHKLVTNDFLDFPRPLISQQDVAAIMYSSGTTGASKGALVTHGNLISMVELFVRFEAFQYEYPSTENVYLALVPMFHIYGMALFVMGLFSLGTTVVVMKRFFINEVVEAIEKFKVTHFPSVPPLLCQLIAKAKCVDGCKLRSLKQICCGAAPTSKKLIEDCLKTLPHVDFIQGYGMTETTAVGTRGFNTASLYNYTSIGLMAPNTQAKIVDWTTGSPLPPGKSGELWLRCPAIMKGYLNNVEATRLTIDEEGWLHTGDVVYFDQDGYLYLSDRLKEMIKYKGFQIAPADLEAVLICHPEILDVAVTSMLDEEAGEVPVAFVVRENGSTLTKKAVMDFLAQQVAPYKKVREVIFTQSIPKSPAGKILRRELKQLLTSKL